MSSQYTPEMIDKLESIKEFIENLKQEYIKDRQQFFEDKIGESCSVAFWVETDRDLQDIAEQASDARKQYSLGWERPLPTLPLLIGVSGIIRRNMEKEKRPLTEEYKDTIRSVVEVMKECMSDCKDYLEKNNFRFKKVRSYKFPEKSIFDDLEAKGITFSPIPEREDCDPEFVERYVDKVTVV